MSASVPRGEYKYIRTNVDRWFILPTGHRAAVRQIENHERGVDL